MGIFNEQAASTSTTPSGVQGPPGQRVLLDLRVTKAQRDHEV